MAKKPIHEQPPLHERVKAHVDVAGLSNAELAKRTGWSELRVWRLLTGRTDIKADEMELLAKLLEKPIEALYRGVA